MLMGDKIAAADLRDWRKLAQGLHARYLVGSFGDGVRFLSAIAAAGESLGHHPSVSMGSRYVDLVLVSDDAVYRDADDGSEFVLQWVTQRDVDLARIITDIAAERGLSADPAAVAQMELGLDTGQSSVIAPVWAALLTGDPGSQGHGSPSDEIRDASRRVPNLWFGDSTESASSGQRFHIEVYLAAEIANDRIAAAIAAGGTIVNDSNSPGLTVIADQDGNRGIICVDTSAAN